MAVAVTAFFAPFAYVAEAGIYCRSFASRPGLLDDATRGRSRSGAAGDLVEERHARGSDQAFFN